MGLALMIKRELVHQFLVSSEVFKIVGKKSLSLYEQVSDLSIFIYLWLFLLSIMIIKSIVIMLMSNTSVWMNFGHVHKLGFYEGFMFISD